MNGNTLDNFVNRETVIANEAEKLARALFETEPEVTAYVRSRSDSSIWSPSKKKLQYEGRPRSGTWDCSSVSIDFEAQTRAFDACWRVNDKGFRAKCEARAKEMLAVMGR